MTEKLREMELPHGSLRFPAFFPDGTRGVVRCVGAEDLEDCRVPGLVMNTYHLNSKPGPGTLKAAGGLNRFIGWNRPILTDSGGFQVFSLIGENPKYGEIRPDGIVFKPDGGEKTVLTPEKCISTQFACASDIMMCLDYCTTPDAAPEVNRISVDTTVRWAKRCKKEFEAQLSARKTKGAKPKLFAIIQGAGDLALRAECAAGLKEIGFEGYGFGGWPLGPDGKLLYDLLAYTAELMPDDGVKYAMGVGRPEEIVACRKMGYTLFDCVIPTREARHNRLFVFNPECRSLDELDLSDPKFYSHYYPEDDRHWRDTRPVSEHCDCICCRRYSRAYLRHLFSIGEPLALRLATAHNLRFYTKLMELLSARES
ncbi:MAG: tRNA guanosine(34) transglycosylase Tgt [Clostridiales bacterium]|nr:tRNA guanosine(34) transglycosylase Tgt [Clostridiales bacterium]